MAHPNLPWRARSCMDTGVGEGAHPRMNHPRLPEILLGGAAAQQPQGPFPAAPRGTHAPVPTPGSSRDTGTHQRSKAVPLTTSSRYPSFPAQTRGPPFEHVMNLCKAKKHQGWASPAFPTCSFPPVSIPHPDRDGAFPKVLAPGSSTGSGLEPGRFGAGFKLFLPHVSHPGVAAEAQAQFHQRIHR